MTDRNDRIIQLINSSSLMQLTENNTCDLRISKSICNGIRHINSHKWAIINESANTVIRIQTERNNNNNVFQSHTVLSRRPRYECPNAGDNPLEINPPGEKPPNCNPPEMNPPVDVHTPEKPPPQYLQNDWLEKLLRIYRFTVLFHFFGCEKLCVADTKAYSLITRSQLANYCVIPTLVSDQSGMSDLLKNKKSLHQRYWRSAT